MPTPSGYLLTSEQSSHRGYVLLQVRAWGSLQSYYCICNSICGVFVIVFVLCCVLLQACAWGLLQEVRKTQLVKCQPVKLLESRKTNVSKGFIHWHCIGFQWKVPLKKGIKKTSSHASKQHLSETTTTRLRATNVAKKKQFVTCSDIIVRAKEQIKWDWNTEADSCLILWNVVARQECWISGNDPLMCAAAWLWQDPR